jgi:hypothetical protein
MRQSDPGELRPRLALPGLAAAAIFALGGTASQQSRDFMRNAGSGAGHTCLRDFTRRDRDAPNGQHSDGTHAGNGRNRPIPLPGGGGTAPGAGFRPATCG